MEIQFHHTNTTTVVAFNFITTKRNIRRPNRQPGANFHSTPLHTPYSTSLGPLNTFGWSRNHFFPEETLEELTNLGQYLFRYFNCLCIFTATHHGRITQYHCHVPIRTHTHTQTHRYTQIDRQRDTQTHTLRDTLTERQTNRETHTSKEIHTETHWGTSHTHTHTTHTHTPHSHTLHTRTHTDKDQSLYNLFDFSFFYKNHIMYKKYENNYFLITQDDNITRFVYFSFSLCSPLGFFSLSISFFLNFEKFSWITKILLIEVSKNPIIH